MPLDDRTFDLVLLSNWEDQIVYGREQDVHPASVTATPQESNLTTPINKALESGSWTQSIIWSPKAPFRDFTQLEFNHEDDVIPEERPGERRSTTTAWVTFKNYCSGDSAPPETPPNGCRSNPRQVQPFK